MAAVILNSLLRTRVRVREWLEDVESCQDSEVAFELALALGTLHYFSSVSHRQVTSWRDLPSYIMPGYVMALPQDHDTPVFQGWTVLAARNSRCNAGYLTVLRFGLLRRMALYALCVSRSQMMILQRLF